MTPGTLGQVLAMCDDLIAAFEAVVIAVWRPAQNDARYHQYKL